MCNIVCLLPFLPNPCILAAEIEDRVCNVVAFGIGAQLERGAKKLTYGTLRQWSLQKWEEMMQVEQPKNPVVGVPKAREEKIGPNKRRFLEP